MLSHTDKNYRAPDRDGVYRGFNISPIGSVIGLIWAFADGAIGGAIFAWLYNLISSRFPRK